MEQSRVVVGLKPSPFPVFFVASLTQVLLPQLFTWFRQSPVRGVLVDPNFFHMIFMEITEPFGFFFLSLSSSESSVGFFDPRV